MTRLRHKTPRVHQRRASSVGVSCSMDIEQAPTFDDRRTFRVWPP